MKNRNKNYKKEISDLKGIDYVKKRKCKRKKRNLQRITQFLPQEVRERREFKIKQEKTNNKYQGKNKTEKEAEKEYQSN